MADQGPVAIEIERGINLAGNLIYRNLFTVQEAAFMVKKVHLLNHIESYRFIITHKGERSNAHLLSPEGRPMSQRL